MVGVLRIGLTGGIGAGKSTVARVLEAHGAVLVDADRLARAVLARGTDGLAEVVETFGQGVLTADGELDRPALGRVVFADEQSRLRLNAITHPRIAVLTAQLIRSAAPDAVVVHDVPLLVENRMQDRYHLVLVVHTPEQERVQRLVGQRGMTEQDARARIAAQAGDDERRALADVWIDNSGAPDGVTASVEQLWLDRLAPYAQNLAARRPAARPSVPALVAPDPDWARQAGRLADRVRYGASEAGITLDDVQHVGPTSTGDAAAVDVLGLAVLVADEQVAGQIRPVLQDLGYAPLADVPDAPMRYQGADPGRFVDLEVVTLTQVRRSTTL